jgi:hypothetical protein
MRMRRFLTACSLSAMFMLGAAGASFANTFPLGVLSPTQPLSESVTAPAGAIDELFTFDFTVQNGPLNVYADLVNGYTWDSNHDLATGLLSSGNASSYIELFQGSPTGAHTLVSGSFEELVYNSASNTVTGTTQTFKLAPGSYYLELVASAPGTSGAPSLSAGGADFTVGVFGSPLDGVPEPAIWGMLVVGVAMIGFAARSRRESLALAY